jgi:hypothetical protein
MHSKDAALLLARTQAGYYLITGILPLVSMRAFEAVTGPKTDRWLVKTVGALVTATGASLALAARRRTLPPELALVAAGNAAALAVVDAVYVRKGRISPIYLLDAVVEVPFVIGWVAAWRRGLLDR